MLRNIFLLFLVALTFACQTKSNKQFSQYHEDGRAKPVVAVVDLINSTSFDYPWSLSEELTSLITSKLSQKHSLYLPETQNLNKKIPLSENIFGIDLSWIKQSFSNYEFVVLIEMLNHDLIPIGKNIPNSLQKSCNLEMTARIRVVDVRFEKPTIVLQEVVSETFFLSKNQIPPNYQLVTWGTKDFPHTPLGVAHLQISKQIAERLNEYILLAKTR